MIRRKRDLPQELQDALVGDWELGQVRRIVHKTREDGTNCSEGKDPALSIMRKADGWWFLCFRCGYSGYIGDVHKSPEEMQAILEGLKKEKEFEALDCITLPADFQCLTDPSEHEDGVNIPYTAYNWFWESDIQQVVYENYNVGWSDVYSRVIIPIYEYANYGSQLSRKLVGWIGRDVRKITKAERKAGGIAKYLTRKSSEYKRIFFHAPWKSNTYVIVEDVLSAMKISHACEVNAIALLTTFVPKDLLLRLRKHKIILWLDNDQGINMMKTTTEATSLGVNCDFVQTVKDPKWYNSVAIRSYIGEHLNV